AGERKAVRREERGPPPGLTHVCHPTERVDDHADGGAEPDRDEDGDDDVGRQPLEAVTQGVERGNTCANCCLATSRDALGAHRCSSCCWNLRMLTIRSGTIATKRTTPTAAARP